jgi:hypothetical protein
MLCAFFLVIPRRLNFIYSLKSRNSFRTVTSQIDWGGGGDCLPSAISRSSLCQLLPVGPSEEHNIFFRKTIKRGTNLAFEEAD